MQNLSSILTDAALLYPKTKAVTIGPHSLSYSQLNHACNQVANKLVKMGVKPGEHVAFACPNTPSFLFMYYGILKMGGVAVPLSIMLKPEEIAYQVDNTDAVALISYEDSNKLLIASYGLKGHQLSQSSKYFGVISERPLKDLPEHFPSESWFDFSNESVDFKSVDVDQHDTAVIIHTSGTTGKQKGAQLTHYNLFENARVVSTENVANINHGDNLLVSLPLFHVFGQTVMMNAGILKGAHLVLMPRFDPNEAVRVMDSEDITIFSGVPTMFWAFLRTKTDNIDLEKIQKQLHTCISGGDSLPLEVFEKFQEKFGITIIEGYGMTEGSPVVTFSHKDRPIVPCSIGTPLEGIEVRIVDELGVDVNVGEIGELIYKGFNVMKGYYNQPEATDQTIKDGWLFSGDLAQMDENGNFFIVGRKKEMIIRSGLNVYPKEVEFALMRHPAISLAAVVGIPDKIRGEEVKAYAILEENQQAEPAEIKKWISEKIALYKCPKIIEFTTELPVSATGKVIKRYLKDGQWYFNN